jgi:hypothetical protein
MRHVIWPEGRPDEAVRAESGLKAFFLLMRMQTALLFPLSHARRVRQATSKDEYADPHASEIGLQLAGAIPPPGGWPPLPEGLTIAPADDGSPSDRVHVTTHSVI